MSLANTLGFGKTCKTCKFWVKAPPNPVNLQDVRGECREGPPHATTHVVDQRPYIMSSYPSLPQDFPACFRHQSKLEGCDKPPEPQVEQ